MLYRLGGGSLVRHTVLMLWTLNHVGVSGSAMQLDDSAQNVSMSTKRKLQLKSARLQCLNAGQSLLNAIGLQPDVKRTMLRRVPASAANKLLASFRCDQPFMVGHTFWHCDLILPRMAAGVNIEVITLIPEFLWLRVGD